MNINLAEVSLEDIQSITVVYTRDILLESNQNQDLEHIVIRLGDTLE